MNGATLWMTKIIAMVSAALITMDVRGQDSCAGYCGEQAPGGCWCDVDCIGFSDCCPDAAEFCCDTWPGIICDPFGCSGACGGQSGEGCWCDASCCSFFDCCKDKCEACGEGHGNCDLFGPCVTESSPCGQPDAGDCCAANDSPGCNNAACCEAVCACDPFCCNVMWDFFCAFPGFDGDECPCGFGMCNATGHPECAHCLTDPPPVGCEGSCHSQSPDGCWCDYFCFIFQDCCDDVCYLCCDIPGIHSWCGDCDEPSCAGFCGGQVPDSCVCPGGCWCDENCFQFLDCCDDVCEACGDLLPDQCRAGSSEGCSLGFWKQPHHFEHWQGYSPDDLFPDAFWVAGGDALQTDAFMGMTLHEVLSQPSGPPQPDAPPQLKNLGKHAVAALLNASSGMSYAFTEEEVKTMFIEAHFAWKAGDGSALTEAKDVFAEHNNAGCALSHPADLNFDAVVNVFDLLILLGNWGHAGLGDVTGDGVVNVFDLLEVLSAWGPV